MDANSFGELCETHRRAVLAYAYACCRNMDLAEDIVQEALSIALQKRGQYFPEADFAGWLISIARNVWFRERRRQEQTSRLTDFIESNASVLFTSELYGEDVWLARRAALSQCVKKLDGQQQRLLNMHFSEGRRYAEIAGAMNRRVGAIKVQMHRLRMALQRCTRLALGAGGVRA